MIPTIQNGAVIETSTTLQVTGSMQDEVMTVPELAAYLKLAERTVYRLARSGSVPATKVGGSWRFRRGAIEQWLAATENTQCPSPTGNSDEIAGE